MWFVSKNERLLLRGFIEGTNPLALITTKEIVTNAGDGAAGVRVGISKGGCAGMEYTIDLVTDPNPSDDKVEAGDNTSVFVDPAATLFLLGTSMDYEVTQLRTGFVFNNPNQTSACGCGESVELKAADLTELNRETVN